MKLKIKPLVDDFLPPVYATPGSAAFDIKAQKDILVGDDLPKNIKLGFATEIPEGYVALIAPRSGLGTQHGFQLRNTIGVIDSDYRGEWNACFKMKIHNHPWMYTIKRGERFLQCLIVPVEQVEFELVDNLNKTERGEGGHGSTGK